MQIKKTLLRWLRTRSAHPRPDKAGAARQNAAHRQGTRQNAAYRPGERGLGAALLPTVLLHGSGMAKAMLDPKTG